MSDPVKHDTRSAGLAADRRRTAGNRVFHGVLAVVIGGTAVFVFATHGGA